MKNLSVIGIVVIVMNIFLIGPTLGMGQKPKESEQIHQENILLEKGKTGNVKLKFLDKSGHIVKEFPLGWEKEKIVKKKHPRIKEARMIKERLNRDAIVSKDKKFVLVVENLMELMVPETEEQERAWDGTDIGYLGGTGNIKYFDNEGNMLWVVCPPKTSPV